MISLKERWGIHIVWTAVASPVFCLLGLYVSNRSYELGKTKWKLVSEVLGKVSEVAVMPGAKVCEWLGGMRGSIPDLGLFVLSEFVCNWVLLFICIAMIEFFINRKSRHA